jgi:hypothetical protein
MYPNPTMTGPDAVGRFAVTPAQPTNSTPGRPSRKAWLNVAGAVLLTAAAGLLLYPVLDGLVGLGLMVICLALLMAANSPDGN